MSSAQDESAAGNSVPEELPEIDAPPFWRVVWARYSQRLRPGQYRLSHLFWLTTIVAIICSLTATLGPPFLEAALTLAVGATVAVAYAFGPATASLVAALFPWIHKKNRKWLAMGIALAMFLPVAALLMVGSPEVADVLVGLGTLTALWLPQVVLLWLLARRRTTRPRKLPDDFSMPP